MSGNLEDGGYAEAGGFSVEVDTEGSCLIVSGAGGGIHEIDIPDDLDGTDAENLDGLAEAIEEAMRTFTYDIAVELARRLLGGGS